MTKITDPTALKNARKPAWPARIDEVKQLKNHRVLSWLAAIIAVMFALAGCTITESQNNPATPAQPPAAAQASDQTQGQVAVEMPHIHGLAFSPDGRQLVVPAHDGLRNYTEGKWLVPDVPVHDYMGFAPADDGFYSSGHPGPSSRLPNPLGLVKSTDGGATLQQLAFLGESDFHLMGVGYQNHAIYVVNPAPNSQLQAGLYYSLDDGESWQQATAQGITAQPIQLAVHPIEASIIALATEGGLFLSDDHGDSFERVGAAEPVTAATFNPDGENLFFGFRQLQVYDLASKQIAPQPSPAVADDDAIGYIAVNPVDADQLALATFTRDIYLSEDGDQLWSQIAEDGRAR